MRLESQIRKLARSTYYQNLYGTAKEIGQLQLFENKSNFSGLQVLFLYWVQVYSMLYTELAEKKWKYLDEKVIDNDDRCDAFLYFRRQEQEKELHKYKQEQQLSNTKLKDKSNASIFNVDLREGI